MPSMLVLRALGLGDLLVAVPALRGLRRHHPDHTVVLAAPAPLAPLARLVGAVDDVLPTPTPDALRWPADRPPDVAVNLHGRGPQSHRALEATNPARRMGSRAPGWPGPDWDALAGPGTHERERWCALVEAFGVSAEPTDLVLTTPPPVDGRRPVLVHPGAAFGAKRWPPTRFAAVARALDSAEHPVLVTGSVAEAGLARDVAARAGLPPDRVLAGRTGLDRLAQLVAHAALVVCGDTGVAHLASAFGTASVVLFGPAPAERWGPPAGPHTVLTDAAARRGDAFADDPDPALLAVGVADVVRAASALLACASSRRSSASR